MNEVVDSETFMSPHRSLNHQQELFNVNGERSLTVICSTTNTNNSIFHPNNIDSSMKATVDIHSTSTTTNHNNDDVLYNHHHTSNQRHHHRHPISSASGSAGGRRRSSSTNSDVSSDDNATPPALLGAHGVGVFGVALASSASEYSNPLLLNNNNGGSSSDHRRPTPSVISGRSPRRYHCKLCPVMFDSKSELQIHTQAHMREAKPYKCSHCPKNFANSSYLSQHMRIHLGIKPFGPCQYCGRKFTQLSHLQQHLRTHTGDKPYRCKYCDKAFSQLSNLQSHSRCHQSDKPYKCNSCYKCFTDEQTLLEHIPKHKESKHLKVHICPFCGKSYTQATYLAKHMSKHSDRKLSTKPPLNDEHVPWSTSAVIRDAAVASTAVAPGTASEPCGGDITPTNQALSFNTFQQAHNHMMQSQNCAYTSAGIASSMAAAGMGSSDPSAFTRLTGLSPLTGRLAAAAASSRNPYFAYENFKTATHPAAAASALTHPSAHYNQFIRLDDIRSYAGQAAAVNAEHFNMLMKRDPRETAYS